MPYGSRPSLILGSGRGPLSLVHKGAPTANTNAMAQSRSKDGSGIVAALTISGKTVSFADPVSTSSRMET